MCAARRPQARTGRIRHKRQQLGAGRAPATPAGARGRLAAYTRARPGI